MRHTLTPWGLLVLLHIGTFSLLLIFIKDSEVTFNILQINMKQSLKSEQKSRKPSKNYHHFSLSKENVVLGHSTA